MTIMKDIKKALPLLLCPLIKKNSPVYNPLFAKILVGSVSMKLGV